VPGGSAAWSRRRSICWADSNRLATSLQFQTFQIASIMQTSRGSGMQTMNDALFDLVKNKLVQPEDAMAKSLAKADLKSALKRINIDA